MAIRMILLRLRRSKYVKICTLRAEICKICNINMDILGTNFATIIIECSLIIFSQKIAKKMKIWPNYTK